MNIPISCVCSRCREPIPLLCAMIARDFHFWIAEQRELLICCRLAEHVCGAFDGSLGPAPLSCLQPSFWEDDLNVGAPQIIRGPDRTFRLDLNGFSIGVFDASKWPNTGVPHHTVEIEGPEDPELLKGELETLGLSVEGPRVHREPGGYSLYVDDPAGNRIELSKPAR